MSFQNLQDKIVKWSKLQFGEEQELDKILAHLIREAEDLRRDPYNPESFADVVILLLMAAYLVDSDTDDLLQAAESKQVINETRKW